MGHKIGILICEHYRREVSAILSAEMFEDAVTATFPARCGRPPLSPEEIRTSLAALGEIERAEIFGAACCLVSLDASPEGVCPCGFHRQEQCFHLIADRDVVDYHLVRGAYLVTPGWLAEWRNCLKRLGLNRKMAREMFREATSRVVLLDTGIDPTGSVSDLDAFADFIDRPREIVPVGLSYLHLLLTKTVLNWHLEKEKQDSANALREIRKQSADHAMALDLLGRLTRITDEPEAIDAMLDVYTMLFAPERVAYLSFREGLPDTLWTRPPLPDTAECEAIRSRLTGFRGESGWTESGKGFLQRIASRGETEGIIAVEGIAFPEYRDHYLNLAHSIMNVCTLAIDNARKYRKLMHAEEKLKRANQKLYQKATTDTLTGIANRRSFDEYLKREWKRTAREKVPLSLIMCDIDLFKNYNDLYGHQEGDACLNAVAQAIHGGAVRPGDFVARYGGEEFVVILPATPAEGALHIAEAIRAAVRRLHIPHEGSQVDTCVTLSLGIASTIPSAEESMENLLQTADAALYDAKQQGRNRVVMRSLDTPQPEARNAAQR